MRQPALSRRELLASSVAAGLTGGAWSGTSQAADPRVLRIRSYTNYEILDPAYPFPLSEKFELLTATKLRKATKTKQVAPVHPVFELCDAISNGAPSLAGNLQSPKPCSLMPISVG